MDRPAVRIALVGFALAIVGACVVFAIANASYTFGCDYPALHLVLADGLLVATVWVGWIRTAPAVAGVSLLVDG